MKLKKEIADNNCDKYITTQESNKLTAHNFVARLARINLASKIDIALKKTDFDDKLKHLNKRLPSNKTKYVLIENKLNELSKRVISTKVISAKGVTKD